MLASGDEQSRDNDVNESFEMLNQQRVIEHESQLLAAAIAVKEEHNAVSHLNCHDELLESKYDTLKIDFNATKMTLNKLDSTRRKASEICLRPPLNIYSHTFSR